MEDGMAEPERGDQGVADRLLRESGVAIIFLTRLPLTVSGAVTPRDLARSAPFFPLVGAGLGLLAGAVHFGAVALGLPPFLAAILSLAALVAMTGGLHEDGLADVADGFGGGRTRAAKLEIMRDPRIGSFGALALVLTLLLRAGALAALAEPPLVIAALIAAGALSRTALPVLMTVLPPARADGIAAGAGRAGDIRSALTVAVGVLIAGLALGPATGGAVFLAASAAAAALGALAARQIGGMTGDVLGAAQQLTEVLVLLTVVALLAATG